jgi:hypothetical protein
MEYAVYQDGKSAATNEEDIQSAMRTYQGVGPAFRAGSHPRSITLKEFSAVRKNLGAAVLRWRNIAGCQWHSDMSVTENPAVRQERS